MEWQLRLFPWFHKWSRTTCTRSPRALTGKTSTYSWLNLPEGRRTTRSHWSKTLGRTGWNQSLLQLNLVLDPVPRNLPLEWCILCAGPWCECAVLHLCRIGTHHHCFARSHKCDAICRHWLIHVPAWNNGKTIKIRFYLLSLKDKTFKLVFTLIFPFQIVRYDLSESKDACHKNPC